MNCSKCESIDTIKYGFNHLKGQSVQKHKCLSCGSIFNSPNKLPNGHIDSEIVTVCMDMYFQGISYRVIKRHLLENYNIKLSHVTIYYWIQQYTELIKRYVDTFKPNLSPVWQMDETFITFKGVKTDCNEKRSDGYYLWVCIDTGTRFIVGMHLGFDRSLEECRKFFQNLIRNAPEHPEIVATDGYVCYETCIKDYFPDASHVKLRQITIDPNTSFIERFNGTIKNRTKTMRCFDSFYPCQTTLTAFRIYYNFLRPHMALNNKTPAQEAGIKVTFPKRWASLIRNSFFCSF